MQVPSPARFRGRAKWTKVATFAVIAVTSAFFVLIIVAAVPRTVTAMMVLAGYTALAGLACLALAVALTVTRRLPTARQSTLDGEPVVLLRAWPLQWWLDIAMDAGLGALGAILFVLDLASGGGFLPWSLVVVVAGAWLLARAVLSLTRRRRNEALWLTPREIVHGTAWGRERCARSQVDLVRQMADWQRLLIVVHGPIDRRLCPRLWRRGRDRLFEDRDMSVDCSLMGPDVQDLVRWVEASATGDGSAVARRR